MQPPRSSLLDRLATWCARPRIARVLEWAGPAIVALQVGNALIARWSSQRLGDPAASRAAVETGPALTVLIPVFAALLLAGLLVLQRLRGRHERRIREAEHEDRVRQVGIDAERSSRARDDFVSTLSHELRTPLQTILGWTQRLRRSPADRSPPELHRTLTTIESNARTLAQSIDDLLEVSYAISGRIALSPTRFDLVALVRSIVDGAMATAALKQVTLTLQEPPAPLRMQGDAERVRQIVGNLVGNALKFTAANGRVEVVVGEAGGRPEVRVRDTGVGIAADLLPTIFDRYVQGSVSTQREYGGLGLGLTIVKHLVELHGGEITAHSAGRGQGAEFIVRFAAPDRVQAPAAPAGASPAAAASRAVPPPEAATAANATAVARLAGRRLLVVDDDADVRLVLETLLAEEGAEVHTAASAEEGFEKLRKLRMDLIVSDIGMPNTDGYVLARSVRGFGNGFSATPTTTPMIALTAFARREDQRRALDSGFNAHLGKPVDVDRLIAALLMQLSDREAAEGSSVTPFGGRPNRLGSARES